MVTSDYGLGIVILLCSDSILFSKMKYTIRIRSKATMIIQIVMRFPFFIPRHQNKVHL